MEEKLPEEVERLQKKNNITDQIEQIEKSPKLIGDKIYPIKATGPIQNRQREEIRIKISLQNEEQLHNVEKQLSETYERQREITGQLKENEEYLTTLFTEMELNESDRQRLELEAEEKLSEKNNTIKQIAEGRKQRLELQQKLEDMEKEVRELKRQHKGIAQILTEEEVKLNRLDVELENRLNTLREDYALTYEGAKEQYPLPVSYEEARKKVKLIKLAIDELGTVNIGAIEEYERVYERYNFLIEQQNDLLQAKDTLYQVINEMDEVMVKRFSETFTAIKGQFDIVFRALFGGGRAELRLTDRRIY